MKTSLHLEHGWICRMLLTLLLCTSLASCGGAGGFSADGGVSGSGISSVTGNVTMVTGANGSVAGIRVLVQGTDIETVTDEDGTFTLSGEFDGPVIVVFELDDGGRAETAVDVPTGGNVDLENVTVDPGEGSARPTRRRISFSGSVQVVDCAGDLLRVVAGQDGERTRFIVRLGDAFVHDGAGVPVACADIHPGDRARVQGEVLEDGSVGAADIEIRRPEPTATPTRTPRPDATRTADRPVPGRTLNPPRPTSTPRVDVRPAPTQTRPAGDRPRPTPTATANDTDRLSPVPIATARVRTP